MGLLLIRMNRRTLREGGGGGEGGEGGFGKGGRGGLRLQGGVLGAGDPAAPVPPLPVGPAEALPLGRGHRRMVFPRLEGERVHIPFDRPNPPPALNPPPIPRPFTPPHRAFVTRGRTFVTRNRSFVTRNRPSVTRKAAFVTQSP
jgi:hypothetical protein